jgi:hypothetical protein
MLAKRPNPCQTRPMGHTDIISKQLIRQLVRVMAHYILGLDLKVIKELRTESERVEQRMADIVMLVETPDGQRFVLHLELQDSNDPSMAYRNMRYYSDLRLAGIKEPIRQFVIYTGKAPLNMADRIEDGGWTYSYSLIDMHRLDCEQFINQNTPEALVIAILCDFKGKDEKRVLRKILCRLIELVGGDKKALRNHIKMMEHLSGNRGLTEIFKAVEVEMLREVDIEKMPSYQIGEQKGLRRAWRRAWRRAPTKEIARLPPDCWPRAYPCRTSWK